MTQSSTPIVTCGEQGIYPDVSSPWFYYRGLQENSSRYLNSGCVIGRAGQV